MYLHILPDQWKKIFRLQEFLKIRKKGKSIFMHAELLTSVLLWKRVQM